MARPRSHQSPILSSHLSLSRPKDSRLAMASKPIPVPTSAKPSHTSLESSEESLAGKLDDAAGAGNVRILSTSIPDLPWPIASQGQGGTAKDGPSTGVPPPITPIAAILHDDPKRRRSDAKSQLLVRPTASKQIAMFAHLPQYERASTVTLSERVKELVHPSVIRLGLRFVNFPLMGAVERCRSMLKAFQQVIRDYTLPPDQAISRHLESHLKPLIAYLVQARPLAVSQSNAIRHLKLVISKLAPDMPVERAKGELVSMIDEYIERRIDAAGKSIADLAFDKICNGDVILTYARALMTGETLKAAARRGKRFRVIVADARPFWEGKDSLLPELLSVGINCTYIHLNAIGYIMREVTKVLVGAFCIFGNGTVMSRTGTSIVCQQGRLHNVPVIVVCETMKFSERVQLDSFVFNEISDPDDLVQPRRGISDHAAAPKPDKLLSAANVPRSSPIADWRSIPFLNLLNILYDVTPPEFITVVICEVGLIPVTSIPVVLREYNIAANN